MMITTAMVLPSREVTGPKSESGYGMVGIVVLRAAVRVKSRRGEARLGFGVLGFMDSE